MDLESKWHLELVQTVHQIAYAAPGILEIAVTAPYHTKLRVP